MASNSNAESTYITEVDDDMPALRDSRRVSSGVSPSGSRCFDIGKERSRVVVSRKDSLCLIAFDPLPCGGFERNENVSITLTPRTVKNLYAKLEEIKEFVDKLKYGDLEKEVSYYLGQRYYLKITPGYKCVSLRKYFKSVGGDIAPGYPGFSFKLEEFRYFYIEMAEVAKIMQLDQIKQSCSPDCVCEDKECNNCKM